MIWPKRKKNDDQTKKRKNDSIRSGSDKRSFKRSKSEKCYPVNIKSAIWHCVNAMIQSHSCVYDLCENFSRKRNKKKHFSSLTRKTLIAKEKIAADEKSCNHDDLVSHSYKGYFEATYIDKKQ